MAGKNNVGNLSVIISGNAAPFIQTLNQTKAVSGQFANQITNITEKVQAESKASGGGGLMQGMVGGFAAGAAMAAFSTLKDGLASVAKEMIVAGAQAELTKASFEVMTGSAEAGGNLFKSIQDLAIQTPYDSAGLQKNAQLLMQMNVSSENILPVLGRLGDIAGGDAEHLKALSLAYGQVNSASKLQGNDLLQFTSAGVGAKDFADTMGKSVAEFMALKEAGQVSSNVVVQTINRLTSAGGRFFGMSEKMNKTVAGQWNSFNESLDVAKQEIGTSIIKGLGMSDLLGGGADMLAPLKQFGQQLEEPLAQVKLIAGDVFDFLKAGSEAFGKAFENSGIVLQEFIPTWGEIREAAKWTLKEIISNAGNVADGVVKLGGIFAEYLMDPLILISVGFADMTKSLLNNIADISEAVGSVDTAASIRGMTANMDAASFTDRLFRVKDGLIAAGKNTHIAADWMAAFGKSAEQAVKPLKEAAQIMEDLKPPAEVMSFVQKIKEEMKGAGMGAGAMFQKQVRLAEQGRFWGELDKKGEDFALGKAFDDFAKTMGDRTTKNTPAMLKGTQAAESTINRVLNQGAKDPMQRIANLLDMANRQQKLIEQHTKDTADAIRKLRDQGEGF